MYKTKAEQWDFVIKFLRFVSTWRNTNIMLMDSFMDAAHKELSRYTDDFKRLDSYALANYLLSGVGKPEKIGDTFIGDMIKREANEKKKKKGCFTNDFHVKEPLLAGRGSKILLRMEDNKGYTTPYEFDIVAKDHLYRAIVNERDKVNDIYLKVRGLELIYRIIKDGRKQGLDKKKRIARVLACKQIGGHGCLTLIESMPYVLVKEIFESYEKLKADREKRAIERLLENLSDALDKLKEKVKSNPDLVPLVAMGMADTCRMATLLTNNRDKELLEIEVSLRNGCLSNPKGFGKMLCFHPGLMVR